MAYRIVYHGEDFLVINKSPGMPVHGDGQSPGLLSLIKTREGLTSLYPVHRLDKVTSGLLVFALNDTCNRSLSMQFEARTIEKYYLALSHKKPKKKQGKISGDMERARRGAWKLLASQNNPALTRFFFQKHFARTKAFPVETPHRQDPSVAGCAKKPWQPHFRGCLVWQR